MLFLGSSGPVQSQELRKAIEFGLRLGLRLGLQLDCADRWPWPAATGQLGCPGR